MTDVRLLDVPGVAESVVPADLLAQLPATTPGPPWGCRVRGTVWLQRGRAPLPAGSPYAPRALAVTLCAVVEYLDSPVGRYREVFAGPLLRRAGLPALHVPFMAVDSLPSLHGGRAHWQLPKSPAGFDGDVAGGPVSVAGEGWRVALDATAAGPAVPVAVGLLVAQAGRQARMSLRARARLARVVVDASGPTLSGWLGAGTHVGVVGEGRMVLGPASA